MSCSIAPWLRQDLIVDSIRHEYSIRGAIRRFKKDRYRRDTIARNTMDLNIVDNLSDPGSINPEPYANFSVANID